ncbi:hypothetical protein H5410_002854 [Solanum commersonii]|uniref:Uncharacterized protein n=1 Tax=Solanum commersonii TaxID=4109 RepID=A0A9J6B356_SOLCO|nr:hypothetical protein H5410_002854 [Solanum commersonii]
MMVLPFKITDQPSFLIYLGGVVRPILRVYQVENPIEENHKLEEDQQDMLNDEFDFVDMNNYDNEIGKDEVSDLGSNNPPTPILGGKNPTSSQSSCVNNHLTSHNMHATTKVIGKYFKNRFSNGKGPSTRDMSNQLRTKLGCKVSYWKIYKGMEHAKSPVRGTHEHEYAVLNVYHYMLEIANLGSKTNCRLMKMGGSSTSLYHMPLG